MALRDDIKLSRDYPNTGVEAFLTIGRTLVELLDEPERFVRKHGITPTQHNVLRILRGSPDGLPQHEIRARMIERKSDISRLLDRLVKQGYARREPDPNDARVAIARITPEGLKLCEKLAGPLNRIHAAQFRKLGKTRTRQLIALLEELREHNRKD